MSYKSYNLRQAYPNELYHHGIRGQKWGVRRFQNKDGSYTAAGRKRYDIGNASDVAKKAKVQKGSLYWDKSHNVISADWHSKKDYKGLTEEEAKALRKTEEGRNNIAEKAYKKEYKDVLRSKEYKESKKGLGLIGKRQLKNTASEIALNNALEKAKNASVEETLNAYTKGNIKLAAQLTALVGVTAATKFLGPKIVDKALSGLIPDRKGLPAYDPSFNAHFID